MCWECVHGPGPGSEGLGQCWWVVWSQWLALLPGGVYVDFFFFFAITLKPGVSSQELSDTKVYEP